MAVFRIEKTKDYTVMANHHLKNKELSLKAKGLLSMILSLPENWNYTTRGLAAICKEGVDSIGTALKELELNGYIVRNRLRDSKGRITDTEYLIYEKPHHPAQADTSSTAKHHTSLPDTALPHTALPHIESPYTGNPYMDTPDTDNPAQLNTNESKKDQINTVNPSIYPSINQAAPSLPNQNIAAKQRKTIKRNIEYYELTDNPSLSIAQLDEIVELMVETLCSTRLTIAVAGD
ncbi:MAG: helix-turn-helix domain-containing protein, partial [Clostridiales bacterium]|nr:helix-turn-helix domain-containing protein [Clostridiales bacterium]